MILTAVASAQIEGHHVTPVNTNTLPFLDFQVRIFIARKDVLDVTIRVTPKAGYEELLGSHRQTLMMHDDTEQEVLAAPLEETHKDKTWIYHFMIGKKYFEAGSSFWFIRPKNKKDPYDSPGYFIILKDFPVSSKVPFPRE